MAPARRFEYHRIGIMWQRVGAMVRVKCSRLMQGACITSTSLFVGCVLLAWVPQRWLRLDDVERVVLLALSWPLLLLSFHLWSIVRGQVTYRSFPSDLDHLLQTKSQWQPTPPPRKTPYLRAGHSASRVQPADGLGHLVRLKHLWLPAVMGSEAKP